MQTKEKKKVAPKASGGKANALQKALQPSEELTAVVGGPAPLSRSEAVRICTRNNPVHYVGPDT